MRYLFLLLAASVLSACGSEKVYSVEHYKEHETERMERLKDCQRLTEAEFAIDKNCAHAIAADKEIESEKAPWFNLERKY